MQAESDGPWNLIQSFVDDLPDEAPDEIMLVRALARHLHDAGFVIAEDQLRVQRSGNHRSLDSLGLRKDRCRLVCKSDKPYDCFWVCL